jgi:hypothetical protein
LAVALVAGRKRLPMPATGNTAFVIFFKMTILIKSEIPYPQIAQIDTD